MVKKFLLFLLVFLVFIPSSGFGQDSGESIIQLFYQEIDALNIKGGNDIVMFYYDHLADNAYAIMNIRRKVEGSSAPMVTEERDKSAFIDALKNTSDVLDYSLYTTEILGTEPLDSNQSRVSYRVKGAFSVDGTVKRSGTQDMLCKDILDLSDSGAIKILRNDCTADVVLSLN